MVNHARITRFIQLLESKGTLTGKINKEQNYIEISTTCDGRVIARRPTSDFDDTSVDLITLIPS